MIIYYVRHGDPVYSPDSLTPLGERQAEAVAKRLALHGIDEIYSSPSERAYKTAKPLSEILKKQINVLDWCDEALAWQEFTVIKKDGHKDWMYGDEQVIEKFCDKKILDLRNEWYKDPFFDKNVGKGVNRINAEADKFLADLGYVHDRQTGFYNVEKCNHKRIAIFAHKGFGTAFLSSILDIPYPLFATHFSFSHSCFSVIYFSDSGKSKITPKLYQHSNDSHLYKEDLPTKYNNSLFI